MTSPSPVEEHQIQVVDKIRSTWKRQSRVRLDALQSTWQQMRVSPKPTTLGSPPTSRSTTSLSLAPPSLRRFSWGWSTRSSSPAILSSSSSLSHSLAEWPLIDFRKSPTLASQKFDSLLTTQLIEWFLDLVFGFEFFFMVLDLQP